MIDSRAAVGRRSPHALLRAGALCVGAIASLVPLLFAPSEAPLPADGGMACQFAIRAQNDIDQDVWILFPRTRVFNRRVNFYSTYLEGQSDRRLAPGESLDTRIQVPGSCNAQRSWMFRVRPGPRGTETVEIQRHTDRTRRTIDLGDASCWATSSTYRTSTGGTFRLIEEDDDAIGCETAARRQGLMAAEEDDEPQAASDAGAGEPPSFDAGSGAAATGAASALAGGEWVRVDGNNPRYNGMRIRVEGDRATLSAMPAAGPTTFAVGQVLWRQVSADGTLQVRGSDGNYYAATLSMDGSDRLDIDVASNGAGNDQTWERAGPSIDGEWVLVEGNVQLEGLRIRVEGKRATVRYVPPAAPRGLRVGDVLWRDLGAGGALEVLSSGRSYRSGQVSLEGEERLRVLVGAGGAVQRWARPGAAEKLSVAGGGEQPLAGPPTGAGGDERPGGGLEAPEDLPGVERPDTYVPPEAGAEDAACLASGLRDDAMGMAWRWEIESAVLPDARAPENDEGTAGRRRFVSDVERSLAPGLPDHFATLSLAAGGRAYGDHREHRDLTGSELDARIESYRGRGFRLSDIEGYETPAGVRYAGVWTRNREGIDWSSSRDLTSEEYGALYRERRDARYRLIDIEVYPTPAGLRYAGIWYRSCDDANWRAWPEMDPDVYQARIDSLGELGFRVVDFESYRTPSGQRYAVIWEKVPLRAWRVRTGRDLTSFLNYHRRSVDEGFRLIDYESYETAEGIRYGGVWAENDPRYRYAGRDSLDALLDGFRNANNLPGVSVVIVQNGEIVYRRGSGWADSLANKWAHSGTVYLTASVSKVIGATLAARLEEQGRIDLRRPTRDVLQPPYLYLQGFTLQWCQMPGLRWLCATLPAHHTHTLEQLLSKTGCMWHYPEGPEPERRYYRWRTEALVQIWDSPLLSNCTPGSTYHYSTHGFMLVGAALEAVTGKPIAQLLEDELTVPFGFPSMRAMYATRELASDYDRATAYSLRSTAMDTSANPDTLVSRPHPISNPNVPKQYEETSWKVLGGGIETNAIDLALFGWETLNGEIVSDSTRDARLWRSLTGGATNWSNGKPAIPVGLAWNLSGSSSDRLARHGGAGLGAGSQLWVWRDRGLVIAMLSNRRYHVNASAGAFMRNLAKVIATWPP